MTPRKYGNQIDAVVPCVAFIAVTAPDLVIVPGLGIIRVRAVRVVSRVPVILSVEGKLVHGHALAMAVAGIGRTPTTHHEVACSAKVRVAADALASATIAGAPIRALDHGRMVNLRAELVHQQFEWICC